MNDCRDVFFQPLIRRHFPTAEIFEHPRDEGTHVALAPDIFTDNKDTGNLDVALVPSKVAYVYHYRLSRWSPLHTVPAGRDQGALA
jgi:hypothetical protein